MRKMVLPWPRPISKCECFPLVPQAHENSTKETYLILVLIFQASCCEQVLTKDQQVLTKYQQMLNSSKMYQKKRNNESCQ